VQLVQGVVDTNAEALLMTEGVPGANSADAMAAADQRGEEWVTLKDPSDPQLEKLNLSEDSLARIRSDLADGYRVMCSAKGSGHGDAMLTSCGVSIRRQDRPSV